MAPAPAWAPRASAFTAVPRPRCWAGVGRRRRPRATRDDGGGGLGEAEMAAVLDKLRKAEQEAQALRDALEVRACAWRAVVLVAG